MQRKILIFLCLMALLLSGCQLARGDGAAPESHDRLVGVFVTEEHLDLFDFEAYVNDHAEELVLGGETVIENTEGYNRRIYANLEDGGCKFEGLDGILFANYAFDEGTVSGYRNAPENRVSDGAVILNETETGVTLTMDGTIFVSDKIGYIQFFYNPVYQTPDGRVYLTGGTGLSSNVTEGTAMRNWHDLSDEYTITANGKTESYRANIRIGVEAIVLPEQYTLLYMDPQHRELGREVFDPGDIPMEIHPTEETAYVLLEHTSHRKDGTQRSGRSIYSRGQSETIEVFMPLENDICVKNCMEIIW